MRKLLSLFGSLALFGLFAGPALASCSGVFLPGAVCANFGGGSAIPSPFVLGTNVPAWLLTPTSANLAAAVTDETGTGPLVFANSPVFTTPNLGTPSALNLANAVNLPGGSVNFSPPGANASATNMQKREGSLPLNLVSDYGAVCDSSTDNSTAIQHWITDAMTLNRPAYAPGCALKYNFSTGIFGGSGTFLEIYGDGKHQSILNYTGTGTAWNISPASTISGYLYVHDIGFYSNVLTNASTLFYQANATQSLYERVSLFNQFYCLYLGTNSFSATLRDVDTTDCGSAGAGAGILTQTDDSANGLTIYGGKAINDGGYAIYLPNGNGVGIFGVDLEGGYGGIGLGGSTGGLGEVGIFGSYIESSGAGSNIAFLGSGSTAVTNAKIDSTWLGASSASTWSNIVGLILKNVGTYNYAVTIATTTSGSIENLQTLGTGGIGWTAGDMSVISPGTASTSPTTGNVVDGGLGVTGAAYIGGKISAGSHILAASTSPAISACGTGSPAVAGSDNFGKITTGGGTLTSCVINFGVAWTTAPACSVSFSASTLAATVATSTTQLTVGATSLTSETIFYTCGSVSRLEPANDNFAAGMREKAA